MKDLEMLRRDFIEILTMDDNYSIFTKEGNSLWNEVRLDMILTAFEQAVNKE